MRAPRSRSRSREFRRVGAASVLALALWSACTPGGTELEFRSDVAYWLDDSTVLRRGDKQLFVSIAVDEWPVAQEIEAWQVEELEPDPQGGRDWRLEADTVVVDGPVRLRREVDLLAARVVEIEARFAAGRGAIPILRFRRAGEEWSSGPGVRGTRRRSAEGDLVRFAVAERSDWSGQIAEIEIVLRPRQESLRLESLRLWSERPDAAAISSVADRGLRVELDHEVQPAFVVSTRESIGRRAALRAGDTLVFGYGLDRSYHGQAVFRVRVDDAVLWEERLGRSPADRNRWHLGRVELPRSDGVSRIRLETESEGLAGVAYWGDPTVLRGTRARREGAQPHLLLVSLDTVRADRMGLYGYQKATTPAIGRWARRRALVFEQAVATAPWTLPSHVSMLSGLDALQHGVNHDVGAATGRQWPFSTLAERLRGAGYDTVAITGGAYLHPDYGFDRGFSSYRYWNDRSRDDPELPEGVDRALRRLSEAPRPTFLFLHTYAAHDPYRARSPHFERLYPKLEPPTAVAAASSPANRAEDALRQQVRFEWRDGGSKSPLGAAERRLLGALYDSGLARVDEHLGRLLGGLESAGLDERTVVVLTSDHGESLGEGGRFGHVDLFDEVLRIPLIVAWPDGYRAGQRDARQVRSIDIAPTLLAAAGVASSEPLHGVGLREAGQSDLPAWSYSAAANRGLSLRHPEYKAMLDNNAWAVVATGPNRSLSGCFDLVQDPGESERISPGQEERCATALSALAEYWRREAQGVRIEFRNGSTGRFEGLLTGEAVRPVATKSIDQGCDCVRWVETGVARFDLAPGDQLTLVLEKQFGSDLVVEGDLTVGGEVSTFSHRFDFRDLGDAGDGLQLSWSEGRWSRGPDDPESNVAITVDRLGTTRDAETGPMDDELRQQLEALGYL